jgi:hypothetical protein
VTDPPLPKAKTERLIVREIDGETLVYDRGRDTASCLNELAARVWRECDGETSVSEIATALGEDERAVWLALHQLTKAQLLTEAIPFPPDMGAAKSRREIGARLGLSAAAFVTSIVAPMPAQAASCLPLNSPCTPVIGPGPCSGSCLPNITLLPHFLSVDCSAQKSHDPHRDQRRGVPRRLPECSRSAAWVTRPSPTSEASA